MKTIRTDQTGGMPLKQYTIKKIQEGYFELFYSMLDFLGINRETGNYIITGCKVVGANITPGWMFVNGDLLYFEGAAGTSATKFLKVINSESAAFKNGQNKPLYYTSSIQINDTGVALSDFVTINQIITLPEGIVIDPNYGGSEPSLLERLEKLEVMAAPFHTGNVSILWMRPVSEIPEGWEEDVDWRGRIPVGMDNSTNVGGILNNPEFSQLPGGMPGRTSGSKTKIIDFDNLPEIEVTVPYTIDYPGGSNTFVLGPGNYGTFPINAGGDNLPMDVLNPVRVALFIRMIQP